MTRTISDTIDQIDEFIKQLELQDVPSDYVVLAKLKDLNDREHVVRGPDLDAWLSKFGRGNIKEARFVLDVRHIREDIFEEINSVKRALYPRRRS